MKPEDVPQHHVEAAARAMAKAVDGDIETETLDWLAEIALAAAFPAHKQEVTAKYRRFVKAVREITRGGEAYQTPKSQGGGGDECTISPPELRQALTDLRHGRS